MSGRPGLVLDVGDLELPGDAEVLALTGVDREAFEELMHAHASPPGAAAPYDEDALGAALLAACAVSPVMTVEVARKFLDDTAGDAEEVVDQCIRLCLPDALDRAWWRLEREPRLSAEMDYCGPLGMPHSQLVGGSGRWSDTDRELALAWDTRRRQTHRCGTRRDQWARDPQAFNGDLWDCPGCLELDRVERSIPDDQRSHVFGYLTPADPDDDGDDGDDD